MDNLTYYFILLLMINISYAQLIETNFYAYYVPVKNLIICSEKEFISSNLILNEFENEEGYTCLINLKKKGIYRVTLNVSKLEENSGLFNDMINNEENIHKSMLEISIGRDSIFHQLDVTSFEKKSSFIKQFIVRFEDGKVSFLPNNDCDLNDIEHCSFINTQDSLFMKKFIKLNFYFRKNSNDDIVLLEKETTTKFKSSEECDPTCAYGICNDGDCVCLQGYMGANCGTKLEPKDKRIGIFFAGLIVITAFMLGIVLMYILWSCFGKIGNKGEVKESSNEVDVMERWGNLNNTET